MKSIKDKAKKFPLSSGVYLFLDKNKNVLYVGRAISLRRRVLNYFSSNIDSRIREMVALAKSIKYLKTDSLLEAVILEANLIKKYWPKYNVKEKDDRSFIYIAIDESQDFPEPIILRGKEIDRKITAKNFRLFGPYQSLSLVNNALKIIRRIFPYSTCKAGHPCFYYQIGLCPGRCIGAVSKNDYRKNIKNIILLLEGKRKKLLEKLKKENPEKAKALEHIQDVALLEKNGEKNLNVELGILSGRIEGYDISHLSGKETAGAMVVFINAEPEKNQYRKFLIHSAANNDLLALEETILRRLRHKEWPLPNFILIDGGRPQVSHISKVLVREKIEIPFAGISKLAGDKLVFPKGIDKSVKKLLESRKEILLKLRDEAHRFAISFSRQKRKIKQ